MLSIPENVQLAQAAGGAAGNSQYMSIIMLVGFGLIFYFLLIRPQKQQQKKRKELLDSLKVGDKIITTNGIYGEIKEIRKNSLRVKVAPDVVLRMDRSGIQGKTSKEDNKED